MDASGDRTVRRFDRGRTDHGGPTGDPDPFAAATDDHQTSNAAEIVAAGGARMIPQKLFTSVELAKQMQKLGLEPRALTNAAARARSVGWPDAAESLADLVEGIGYARLGLAQPVREFERA